MKFAVANQFFMIADQAGVDYAQRPRRDPARLPARRRPARARASPPARACFKDTMQLAAFTTDHFPLGQAAMQVNEGLPAYIVSALERRYGTCAGGRSGSSAWPSRPSRTTPRRRSPTSSASCCAGPARASSAPTRTSATTASCRSRRCWRRPTSSSSARRTAPTADLDLGDREVVDVWGALGRGIDALMRDPRHRRRRLHQRLPRARSCSRPATRSSASTTSASTARAARATTTTRATASSRATPRTWRSLRSWPGLRPGRRRRRR